MSLAKTAFWGIVILAFAMLLDLLLLVRLAAADESIVCPKVWMVASTPEKSWSQVQIAEGFDPGDAECRLRRTSTQDIVAGAEFVGGRFTAAARYPLATTCTVDQPCTVVVGVRTPSCEPAAATVVYADGAAEINTRVRRTRADPDSPTWGCESETIFVIYLAAPRMPASGYRWLAVTADLK